MEYDHKKMTFRLKLGELSGWIVFICSIVAFIQMLRTDGWDRVLCGVICLAYLITALWVFIEARTPYTNSKEEE